MKRIISQTRAEAYMIPAKSGRENKGRLKWQSDVRGKWRRGDDSALKRRLKGSGIDTSEKKGGQHGRYCFHLHLNGREGYEKQ